MDYFEVIRRRRMVRNFRDDPLEASKYLHSRWFIASAPAIGRYPT
ncbi:hypothetical protein [Haladaptatus sp.]